MPTDFSNLKNVKSTKFSKRLIWIPISFKSSNFLIILYYLLLKVEWVLRRCQIIWSKKKVLFLCTGNSCRSQMAEGFVKHDLSKKWKAYSAGTEPSGYVHPLAIEAMAEMSDGRSMAFSAGSPSTAFMPTT